MAGSTTGVADLILLGGWVAPFDTGTMVHPSHTILTTRIATLTLVFQGIQGGA